MKYYFTTKTQRTQRLDIKRRRLVSKLHFLGVIAKRRLPFVSNPVIVEVPSPVKRPHRDESSVFSLATLNPKRLSLKPLCPLCLCGETAWGLDNNARLVVGS
jgi:hypothetical protein